MSSTLIHYQRNLDPEQGVGAVHRTALQVFPLLTPSENVSAFILRTAIPTGEEVCSGAAVRAVWDRAWQGWDAVTWLPAEQPSPGAQHDPKKREQAALL